MSEQSFNLLDGAVGQPLQGPHIREAMESAADPERADELVGFVNAEIESSRSKSASNGTRTSSSRKSVIRR